MPSLLERRKGANMPIQSNFCKFLYLGNNLNFLINKVSEGS